MEIFIEIGILSLSQMILSFNSWWFKILSLVKIGFCFVFQLTCNYHFYDLSLFILIDSTVYTVLCKSFKKVAKML